MKKSEIFNLLIDKICEECEVTRQVLVLRDRRIQAVVEARMLAVHYLKEIGLDNDTISLIVLREQKGDQNYMPPSKKIKAKSKAIDKLTKAYNERKKMSRIQAFELQEMAIRKFCHEEYEKVREPWMAELKD